MFHVSRSAIDRILTAFLFFIFLSSIWLPGFASVTSPKQQFGFDIGDDYQLVNFKQLLSYWQKLDAESDRMTLVDIGPSEEGRPIPMAIITSPENQASLGRYKEISRRLALARGLTDDEAKKLASEGKAVVWIDGGLHASEILGSQQLIELVWQMVSGEDAETLRLLDDCILLAVLANPDGLDLVADWYMKEKDPAKRSLRGVPVLYQKYIGHDNNRDFYMVTQAETEAMSRQLYREWHPIILYNHHQSGPAGTVLFAPPFRDPFNYVFDPLIPVSLELVGAAMHNRFVAEGKPGATMRHGASYSTWWNGGLRSTGYFHNVIGILTETIGNPTPMEIPFIPDRLLPKHDYPFPVAPQEWHFRQSVDYCITADKAILDIASRYREHLLYQRYLMGRNSIDKGSRDSWTVVPTMFDAVQAALAKDKLQTAAGAGGRPFGRGVPVKYYGMLFDKATRDPRGYIIPADQPDFLTATKFVNTLLKTGCEVHRATKEFTVNGKSYPEGSYVVKTAQAFRPHVLSLFESQNHPNDFAYPGGPPVPPYDAAGWTLTYQMGVEFDRIFDGFDGPFKEVPDVIEINNGRFEERAAPAGYVIDHRLNDSFVAVNRVLAEGGEVLWLKNSLNLSGLKLPAGAFFFPAGKKKDMPASVLRRVAREKGLDVHAVGSRPSGPAFKLSLPRIGLWDTYGGSIASGWMRWLLEEFEFPYELVFAPILDEGRLKDKFDVLVFVGGSIPRLQSGESGRLDFNSYQSQAPANIPDEYKNRVGRVTAEKTIPQIKLFLEQGGTVLALDSATALAYHLKLSLADALVEKNPEGQVRSLNREKFYIPGSILRARVDNSHPLAHGMPPEVDVFFDNTPSFALLPESAGSGIKTVVWFGDGRLLRSGWSWGEGYLQNTSQVLEARVGKGRLFLYGPMVVFRGQPHGTFKLVFNGFYYGPAANQEFK